MIVWTRRKTSGTERTLTEPSVTLRDDFVRSN